MELNKNLIFRSLSIFVGIILLIFTTTNFSNSLAPTISNFMLGDFANINFEFSIIINLLLLLGSSFIFLYIGFTWSNIFKHLSKILISFAIFILSISIFMFALNIHSSEIVDSIQPSIDYVLAYSLDDAITGQLEILDNEIVKVQVSENTEFETFYVSNLTSKQAESFSEIFDLSAYSIEDKTKLSKIFISSIYDEMQKVDPNSVNAPVSLSFLKSTMEEQGINMDMFKLLEISELENFFQVNDEAYLNILISNKTEILEIHIGSITSNQVELIWSNLGLSQNISYHGKEKITKIFLSEISKQKTLIGDVAIPIQTIASALPQEIKSILNYDIFSNNLSTRVIAINQIRDSCELKKINSTEICDVILLSKYDNLMQNINNLSIDQNMSINLSFLENYNSLEKVEIYFEESTSSWLFYGFIFILLNIFAYFSYWVHFKLFKRELIKFHLAYFVTKHNLLNQLFTLIIFAIIYYYIITDKLIDTLIMVLGQSEIAFLKDLMIYNSIQSIFTTGFYIMLILFIINLILYALFFFLQKNELEKSI